MWLGDITTDFNGIVLFEPTLLEAFHGSIEEGADLFGRYRTTDEGDQVLSKGIIVPILAIDDAGYQVTVRQSHEAWQPPGEIVAENGVFALHVAQRLVLADLVVLKEWVPELGWTIIPVDPGYYVVNIRGFAARDAKRHITTAGYDIVLERTAELPAVSAELERNMRVFDR